MWLWIGVCIGVPVGLSVRAGDWPQWRGPARDGACADAHLPETWPEHLTLPWEVPVGPGLASPVWVGDSIYVFTRDGDDEVVTCLAADDGKQQCRQRYRAVFYADSQAPGPRLFPASKGKGPFASPLLDRGRLYTLGVGKLLSCLDTGDGRLLWRHAYDPETLPDSVAFVCPPCNAPCDQQTYDHDGPCPGCGMMLNASGTETSAVSLGNYYGAAGSPLIAGGLGLVQVRTGERGALSAFDPRTGAERWSLDTPVPASASPLPAILAGVPQVVLVTRESLQGVARDGKPLWTVPLTSNAQIVTPVVVDDLVVYATYRGPVSAVRISHGADGWTAVPAWTAEEHPLVISSPILVGDALFGHSSKRRGRFFSLDVHTGATRWADDVSAP